MDDPFRSPAPRHPRREHARRSLVPVVLVVVAACAGGDGPPTGVVAVDEPLPAVEARSLDGDTVSTEDLRGSPSVVNVWATWCVPCKTELPELVEVASAYEGRVGFLGVNYVDDAAQARTFVEDFGIPYPSIDDDAGALADDLRFLNLPHTLVVDAGGTIRYRIYGETTSEELSGLLDGLLADASGAR